MDPILLCTDLDRTLLPNGYQPESPGARKLFDKLAAFPFVSLAYVSGRDLGLLEGAIEDYQLPIPDFMLGDVGTTIFRNNNGNWEALEEWQKRIAQDWQGITRDNLETLLADIKELTVQEREKQGTFKLSYYTSQDIAPDTLIEKVNQHLTKCPARVSLVHSIDEVNKIGLFDILPASATKLHGVRFLIERSGISPTRTIYAGDSGNDMEVFLSRIKTVLVANSSPEIQAQALNTSFPETVYIARGELLNMNGNYAAGILEGLAHYLPETIPLLE
jgi:HAD superfamily hydrolase (TIGR01484 family)